MLRNKLTIILLLIATVAFSQKLDIGLKAGMNSTDIAVMSENSILDPSLPSHFGSGSTVHFGIYGLFKFSKIGIQPEILYSPRKNNASFTGSSLEQKRTYLDIPVLFKWYLPAGVNFHVGPQIGFLLSADSGGQDAIMDWKDFDKSLVLGLGWDAPFGLQANVRYIISMQNINQDNDLAVRYTDIRNRTLQISVGYRILELGK